MREAGVVCLRGRLSLSLLRGCCQAALPSEQVGAWVWISGQKPGLVQVEIWESPEGRRWL